jgi:hypothetical protein
MRAKAHADSKAPPDQCGAVLRLTLATIGGPTYAVAASASSRLPVSLSIDASATSVCRLIGSTVSFTGAGLCVIDANQAGTAAYLPAAQAQQSLPVEARLVVSAPTATLVGGRAGALARAMSSPTDISMRFCRAASIGAMTGLVAMAALPLLAIIAAPAIRNIPCSKGKHIRNERPEVKCSCG